MIVTCPNCGARYRLAAPIADGARMRCADCDHRWIPTASPPPPDPRTAEAAEEAAFAQVQAAMQARRHEPPAPPPPADSPPQPPEDPTHDAPAADPAPAQDSPQPPRLLQSVIAIITGLALAVVAAGLWIGRVDVASLPWIGPALAPLAATTPLQITATGVVTRLPSGRRVLDVTGTVANRGPGAATVPPLAASLGGPGGVALRWTIKPPVQTLPAGQQVSFTSSVTGFPAKARTLTIGPTQ